MARRSAVQALYQQELSGDAGPETIKTFVQDWGLTGVDIEYFSQLVAGVSKYANQLDEIISKHLDRSISSVDPIERIVLRLGVYELQYMPDIPIRVVLDEAVELARVFGAEEGYRFVNGVLDKCKVLCRNLETESI
ncbi:MAG: transcription antitermination factor NusB [Acidiferrobacteraceae bacterium]|nr:transcription antitermination factor NusB [Acidiferrobacteraceae bacterium]